jgi:hypothetical protein
LRAAMWDVLAARGYLFDKVDAEIRAWVKSYRK